MDCPYKPCGANDENCPGCVHDPQRRTISQEQFYDAVGFLDCRSCRHYVVNADLPHVESKCKRLDHKHLKFQKPTFQSYCCVGMCCADYEPAEIWRWLHRHWNAKFLRKPTASQTIGIVEDSDFEHPLAIRYDDFFYNRFVNDDGSLKWVSKTYYKRSKSSPFGYVLLTEYPDGHIVRYHTDEDYRNKTN